MKRLLALSALLTVVMAFALYTWVYQLQNGLGVTGMNKPVFWGLYIVTFVLWFNLHFYVPHDILKKTLVLVTEIE